MFAKVAEHAFKECFGTTTIALVLRAIAETIAHFKVIMKRIQIRTS